MTGRRALLLLALPLALPLLGACGDDDGDGELTGPKDYNLTFDRVDIERQEDANGKPTAIRISYVRLGGGDPEFPVRLAANEPIAVGVDKFLIQNGKKDGGNVWRATAKNDVFPTIEMAKVRFDTLGDVGSTVDGEFFVTFTGNSGTISGKFSGTLQRLTFQ